MADMTFEEIDQMVTYLGGDSTQNADGTVSVSFTDKTVDLDDVRLEGLAFLYTYVMDRDSDA